MTNGPRTDVSPNWYALHAVPGRYRPLARFISRHVIGQIPAMMLATFGLTSPASWWIPTENVPRSPAKLPAVLRAAMYNGDRIGGV